MAARPEENARSVSLVLVSPSTLAWLNVASATRQDARQRGTIGDRVREQEREHGGVRTRRSHGRMNHAGAFRHAQNDEWPTLDLPTHVGHLGSTVGRQDCFGEPIGAILRREATSEVT